MKEFKFDYDSESDDLFIYSGKGRSKGAVELGDLILDFDSNKDLTALEIMNASKFIQEMLGKDIIVDRGFLENIKSCSLDIRQHQNMLLIRLLILSRRGEVMVPITAPSVKSASPSLIYA